MVLNSVVKISLDVVEELVIGVLDVVLHVSSEVVLRVMVVEVTSIGWVSSVVVSEIMSLKVMSVAMMVSVVVSGVVWVVGVVVVHISDPVIWEVLNSMGVMVVSGVCGAVLLLITVTVVGAVVAIDVSIEVVVLTMLLSSVVSVVAKVWLVVLQLPVALFGMGEWVVVHSMDGSGVMWVLVMSPFMWSHIVVRHVPSAVEVVLVNVMISMMSLDWVVVDNLVLRVVVCTIPVWLVRDGVLLLLFLLSFLLCLWVVAFEVVHSVLVVVTESVITISVVLNWLINVRVVWVIV